MTPPLRPTLLAAALALCLGACGDQADVWNRPRDIRGPVPLAGHLAWLDATLEQLVTVEADERAGGGFDFHVVRQPVGRNPVQVVPSVGLARALVLCHGALGAPGTEPQPERLYVLDPAGEAEPIVYDLHSPFDALAQTAAGDRVVAYFAAADAVNPNEMAVVDLVARPPAPPPTLINLRTYGSRPLAVHFLENLTIGSRDRQLALVFSQRYVTFVDLEQLDRRVTTVFLSARGSTDAVISPAAAVVAPGDATDPEGATPYVFLRAGGIAEVFALNMKDNPAVAADQNDFTPSVNQIPVPAPPTDFAVFDGAGGPSLLAVHPQGTVAGATIVNPRTTESWTVTLDARANALRLFTAVPTRDGERDLALLWDGGGSEARAGFLVLDDVETRLRRNLETIDLGATVVGVLPTGDPLRVLLLHGGRDAGLSILHVGDRTVSRLGIRARTDLSATHPEGRAFYFADPEPPAGCRADVFHLTLESGHAEAVCLDAQPAALYALPGSGSAARGRALLVDHGWGSGYVTALSLDAPDRAGAASIVGFFADGMLDVDPEAPGTEVH